METILRWLDRGDIKKLALKAMISERQAHNIIKGKSKNYSFIERMVEQAEHNMRLAQRTQILQNNLYLIQK
ncbi:MAG: hypothetical protein WAZ98_03750 [Cyclobacteriaceae bacterium]